MSPETLDSPSLAQSSRIWTAELPHLEKLAELLPPDASCYHPCQVNLLCLPRHSTLRAKRAKPVRKKPSLFTLKGIQQGPPSPRHTCMHTDLSLSSHPAQLSALSAPP